MQPTFPPQQDSREGGTGGTGAPLTLQHAAGRRPGEQTRNTQGLQQQIALTTGAVRLKNGLGFVCIPISQASDGCLTGTVCHQGLFV